MTRPHTTLPALSYPLAGAGRVTTHPQDLAAVLTTLADAWDAENNENAGWADTLPDHGAAQMARGRTRQGRRYAHQLRTLIAQLEQT